MNKIQWLIRETILLLLLFAICAKGGVWIKVGLVVALISCELHDLKLYLDRRGDLK